MRVPAARTVTVLSVERGGGDQQHGQVEGQEQEHERQHVCLSSDRTLVWVRQVLVVLPNVCQSLEIDGKGRFIKEETGETNSF
jgi:hypothetical protein